VIRDPKGARGGKRDVRRADGNDGLLERGNTLDQIEHRRRPVTDGALDLGAAPAAAPRAEISGHRDPRPHGPRVVGARASRIPTWPMSMHALIRSKSRIAAKKGHNHLTRAHGVFQRIPIGQFLNSPQLLIQVQAASMYSSLRWPW